MTDNDLRASHQYKNNPFAKVLVDTLCAQIGMVPTTGSVLMILAHDGLLSMLELGHDEINKELVRRAIGGGPIDKKVDLWLKP